MACHSGHRQKPEGIELHCAFPERGSIQSNRKAGCRAAGPRPAWRLRGTRLSVPLRSGSILSELTKLRRASPPEKELPAAQRTYALSQRLGAHLVGERNT